MGGRALLRVAFGPVLGTSLAGPVELLPDALLLIGLVWLGIDTMEQRRVSPPRVRLIASERVAALATVGGFVCAGAAAAALLWGYERLLAAIAVQSSQDLLRFSLHPFEAVRHRNRRGARAVACGAWCGGRPACCGCPRFCGAWCVARTAVP